MPTRRTCRATFGAAGMSRGFDSRRLHVLIGPAAARTSLCSTMKTVSMRGFARHVRLARARLPWWTALCLIGLALVSGCQPSAPALGDADVSIRQDLLRGVGEIRGTRDRKKLHAELVHLLAHLRRAHGTTASARRGREFALRGFEATLKGVRSISSTSARTTAGRSPPRRGTRNELTATEARRVLVTRGRTGIRASDWRAQRILTAQTPWVGRSSRPSNPPGSTSADPTRYFTSFQTAPAPLRLPRRHVTTPTTTRPTTMNSASERTSDFSLARSSSRCCRSAASSFRMSSDCPLRHGSAVCRWCALPLRSPRRAWEARLCGRSAWPGTRRSRRGGR